jgi:succinyl-diaminopimelate desuccinylase
MSYSVPPNIKIDPIRLTQDSVRCASVTPLDNGALQVLASPLRDMGFDVYELRFEEAGTDTIDNFFARLGKGGKHLCYLGHTDVVPAGRESDWTYPPFEPVIDNGILYGRGTADMKGGNAAFVAAVSEFLLERPDFSDSISLLITGDEEAKSINGTAKVIEWMKHNNHMPDVALVGEPSNFSKMGEVVRVGRRGSLTGHIVVEGKQGHSAYPERADNPIPKLIKLLSILEDEILDAGSSDFIPSKLVITTVDVGNTASNVIPARAEARFNIRFNSHWTAASLGDYLRALLDKADIVYTMTTRSTAQSFVTENHLWRDLVCQSIEKISGQYPKADTGGGTSDARFIAPYCPVVEYGLINATIHQVDEHVRVDDVYTLTQTYLEILRRYFSGK